MNNGKILLGFLYGISVGAVLGILIAPRKDSANRKQLIREGAENRKDLIVTLNQLEEIAEKFDEKG